jgi:hypothetical protein
MKTSNEVVAMSYLDLVRDHARLDTQLEIRNHEVAQLHHGLQTLVKELSDAKRYTDALRVLKIEEITGKSVRAYIDAIEAERKL